MTLDNYLETFEKTLERDITTANSHGLTDHADALTTALEILREQGLKCDGREFFTPIVNFYKAMLKIEEQNPGTLEGWKYQQYFLVAAAFEDALKAFELSPEEREKAGMPNFTQALFEM